MMTPIKNNYILSNLLAWITWLKTFYSSKNEKTKLKSSIKNMLIITLLSKHASDILESGKKTDMIEVLENYTNQIEFKTPGEVKAYFEGIEATDGWLDAYAFTRSDFINEDDLNAIFNKKELKRLL
jgi:hypothetical protein